MGSGDGYWKYIDIRQNETKELVGDTVIETVKCGTKGVAATTTKHTQHLSLIHI